MEAITLNNPSGTPLSYKMTKTYTETAKTSWFSKQTMELRTSGGLQGEMTGGPDLEGMSTAQNQEDMTDAVKLDKQKTVWISTQTEETRAQSTQNGASTSTTTTKSYSFVCQAQPFTNTSCRVLVKEGIWKVPYSGHWEISYASGRTIEVPYSGIYVFNGGKDAFIESTEESTLCAATVFEGRCWDTVKSTAQYTFQQATDACYAKGMNVAIVNGPHELRMIHQMCNYREMWLSGWVDPQSLNSVNWVDGNNLISTGRWSRFDESSTFELGEQGRILVAQGSAGFWSEVNMTNAAARCIACVGSLDEVPRPVSTGASEEDEEDIFDDDLYAYAYQAVEEAVDDDDMITSCNSCEKNDAWKEVAVTVI